MFLLSQTIKEENLCTHLVILTKKDRYRYIGYRQKTITKNMAGNTMECNSSYLAMVVGDNEPTATKNAGESLAIMIAMAMERYDAGHIAQ